MAPPNTIKKCPVKGTRLRACRSLRAEPLGGVFLVSLIVVIDSGNLTNVRISLGASDLSTLGRQMREEDKCLHMLIFILLDSVSI